MKVDVNFANDISVTESQDLDELLLSLKKNSLTVSPSFSLPEKGAKSPELIIALNIIATGFSVLAAIASSVSAWGDSKKYNITLKASKFDCTVTGLSNKEFEDLIEQIKKLEEEGVQDLTYIIRS